MPISEAIEITYLLRMFKRQSGLNEVLLPITANCMYVPKINVTNMMQDGIKMFSTRQSFLKVFSFRLFR